MPIPFDGSGQMEVDLLAAGAHLAVDGGQHLDSPEAYRRDRRKDLLLQEQGYFVLRFLAEDLGKELDAVLDAIQRVLAHRLREAGEGCGNKWIDDLMRSGPRARCEIEASD